MDARRESAQRPSVKSRHDECVEWAAMDDSGLLRLVTLAVAEEGGTAPHAYRVTAHGEIDLESAPRLTEAFNAIIEDGATIVILDASDVAFLDSSGLRAIIQAGHRLTEVGGQLLIEGMSGAVQRVLEISGVIDQYRARQP